MKKPFRPALLPFVAILLVLFSVSGCEKLILGGGDSQPPARTGDFTPKDPLEEARAALAAGNFSQAEVAAQKAAVGASGAKAAQAYEILAKAAAQNAHPNLALTALDQWRNAATEADGTEEWQNVWCYALRGLPKREALSKSDAVYRDTSRSETVRAAAAAFTAVRRFEEGTLGDAPAALEQMYANTSDNAVRRILERRLATELAAASTSARTLAATCVSPENEGTYPYSIISIDALRRQTLVASTRETAHQKLRELAAKVKLVDPSLFESAPAAGIASDGYTPPTPSGPISGRAVVLVLPMGGQYAGISGKIVAGAEVACKELSATLVVIDTEQPNWAARIDGLPPEAVVIGGPLRNEDIASVKTKSGSRAFFAFRPSVEGEGSSMWRFFPSPEDQVDTLLNFTSGLGITGYAAFYPDEPYGRRMTSLFTERAASKGSTGIHTATYNPREPASWLRATGDLLSANKNTTHSQGATFQAIFLPDTWKSMDMIVPNIFYYKETRQVLLGTNLWEQGLAGKPLTSPQYWSLAVFPGAWNPQATQGAAMTLQNALLAAGKPPADFWSALGYDFARFAASAPIQGAGAGSVNSAVSSFNMNWSMAPIRWDSSGRAAQEMFLLTPAREGGFAPVNTEEFRRAFSAAWK